MSETPQEAMKAMERLADLHVDWWISQATPMDIGEWNTVSHSLGSSSDNDTGRTLIPDNNPKGYICVSFDVPSEDGSDMGQRITEFLATHRDMAEDFRLKLDDIIREGIEQSPPLGESDLPLEQLTIQQKIIEIAKRRLLFQDLAGSEDENDDENDISGPRDGVKMSICRVTGHGTLKIHPFRARLDESLAELEKRLAYNVGPLPMIPGGHHSGIISSLEVHEAVDTEPWGDISGDSQNAPEEDYAGNHDHGDGGPWVFKFMSRGDENASRRIVDMPWITLNTEMQYHKMTDIIRSSNGIDSACFARAGRVAEVNRIARERREAGLPGVEVDNMNDLA